MIDHIGLLVSDYQKSKAFYLAVLPTTGADFVIEVSAEQTGSQPAAGFERGMKPDVWIGPGQVGIHTHVAFVAESRQQADGFFTAALAASGNDNNAPDLRPHYHRNDYGAFILNPDGYNIEAVCHSPELQT